MKDRRQRFLTNLLDTWLAFWMIVGSLRLMRCMIREINLHRAAQTKSEKYDSPYGSQSDFWNQFRFLCKQLLTYGSFFPRSFLNIAVRGILREELDTDNPSPEIVNDLRWLIAHLNSEVDELLEETAKNQREVILPTSRLLFNSKIYAELNAV